MNNRLPEVPTIGSNGVSADAEHVVAMARGRALGEMISNSRKPSGAWYKQAARAKARGQEPPPRPAPRPRPVVEEAPPNPAPPAPERAPERLTVEDVREERQATAAAEQRAVMLAGPERARLEERIGSVAQLAFTGAGYLLNKFQTAGVWPLDDAQKENVAVLLVEAFPDECAELVQGGTLVKALAIGTVARIVVQKWELHKAGPVAVVAAPQAPVIERAPEPSHFAGVPDMRSE